MSKNRFYIGEKDDPNVDGNLEEWIFNKIPSASVGATCECKRDECHANVNCHDEFLTSSIEGKGMLYCIKKPGHEDGHHWRPEEDSKCKKYPDSYVWKIEDGHVCFTYVCEACCERGSDDAYFEGQDYPTTNDGYAVVPSHCA